MYETNKKETQIEAVGNKGIGKRKIRRRKTF